MKHTLSERGRQENMEDDYKYKIILPTNALFIKTPHSTQCTHYKMKLSLPLHNNNFNDVF
jgi:hypothetical protein